MKVQYFGRMEHGYGNITWAGRWPALGRAHPKPHPCADNQQPLSWGRGDQPKTDDPLGRFRARDYHASCFPEGDGIAFDPPTGKTTAEIVCDIEECFGFEVEVVRP